MKITQRNEGSSRCPNLTKKGELQIPRQWRSISSPFFTQICCVLKCRLLRVQIGNASDFYGTLNFSGNGLRKPCFFLLFPTSKYISNGTLLMKLLTSCSFLSTFHRGASRRTLKKYIFQVDLISCLIFMDLVVFRRIGIRGPG